MAGPVLYMIGAILMRCPATLNPQEAIEEFGYDYAVKPIVGAQQPREKVGPSDTRLNLMGVIFPYRFAAAGLGDGQDEINTLKNYCAAGDSMPVLRADGTFMGWYFIEKVQLRHTFLSIQGIGRRQEFAIQMVQDPEEGTADVAQQVFGGIVSLIST